MSLTRINQLSQSTQAALLADLILTVSKCNLTHSEQRNIIQNAMQGTVSEYESILNQYK